MKNNTNTRELIVSSALYASSSIIGPLLVFGGLGFMLDRLFDSRPWVMLAGVLVAFIITNVLLFKKIMRLNADIEKAAQKTHSETNIT